MGADKLDNIQKALLGLALLVGLGVVLLVVGTVALSLAATSGPAVGEYNYSTYNGTTDVTDEDVLAYQGTTTTTNTTNSTS